jgi:hypothetical protein
MSTVIVIKQWERFQHYKDRDPPWVKLYRDTLTTEAWVLGTDISRLIQLASTMLAARYSNKIPLKFDLIQRVLTLGCDEQTFLHAITHLVEYDFFELQEVEETPKRDASALLASCNKKGPERQRQSRSEAEESRSDLSGLLTQPGAKAKTADDIPEFEELQTIYPKRAGSQRWDDARKHYRARRREGHAAETIIAGVRRYAEFARVTGKERTEVIQQAATFLGTNCGFLETWAIPRAPPDQRPMSAVDRVRLANGEAKRDERVVSEQRNGQGFGDLDVLGGDVREPVNSGLRRLGS